MVIDLNKLKKAGFHVSLDVDRETIEVDLVHNSVDYAELRKQMERHAKTPLGQDLIMATMIDVMTKVRFLESL